LKKKVEAGADFVITQLFYDVDVFIKFVEDCKTAGITVPILPGVMPIMNFGGFKRMTGFCKTHVPEYIKEAIDAIGEDGSPELIKAFGVLLGTLMVQRLLDAGVPGIHMYTLNLDKSAVKILQHAGLVDEALVKK
jgi:methylenetetrahydrofolate reductase (NADPH)